MVPLVADERVYSTPELLALEQRVLEHAIEGRAAGRAVVRDRAVERALRQRPTISQEQAEMVRRLATDGASVSLVVGQAGTGKTFALAAAREAWETRGYAVVGAALSWRAARELEERRHPEREHRGFARAAAGQAEDDTAGSPVRPCGR